MEFTNGYIKLFRSIKNWRYYRDTTTKVLYIHLLMSAAFSDCDISNIRIPKGYYYTSLKALSAETGLTIQQIRTAISKLDGEEITVNTVHKKTLIRINNYEIYQNNVPEKRIVIDDKEYFTLQSIYVEKNGKQPGQIELKKIYSLCEYNQVQREKAGQSKIQYTQVQEHIYKSLFGESF